MQYSLFVVILPVILLLLLVIFVNSKVNKLADSIHNDIVSIQQHCDVIAAAIKKDMVKNHSSVEESLRLCVSESRTRMAELEEMTKALAARLEVIASSQRESVGQLHQMTEPIRMELFQLASQTDNISKQAASLQKEVNKLGADLESSMKNHIFSQEASLNGLVEKHVSIACQTAELNQTCKDVYELMKLNLMNSIMEETRFLNDK